MRYAYYKAVKRIFTDRARLVVYVEAEELNGMTALARGSGKTLVEWAREVLREKLEGGNAVRAVQPVRVSERRTSKRGRSTLRNVEDITHATIRKTKAADVGSVGSRPSARDSMDFSGVASDDHERGCRCAVCDFKKSILGSRA